MFGNMQFIYLLRVSEISKMLTVLFVLLIINKDYTVEISYTLKTFGAYKFNSI